MTYYLLRSKSIVSSQRARRSLRGHTSVVWLLLAGVTVLLVYMTSVLSPGTTSKYPRFAIRASKPYKSRPMTHRAHKHKSGASAHEGHGTPSRHSNRLWSKHSDNKAKAHLHYSREDKNNNRTIITATNNSHNLVQKVNSITEDHKAMKNTDTQQLILQSLHKNVPQQQLIDQSLHKSLPRRRQDRPSSHQPVGQSDKNSARSRQQISVRSRAEAKIEKSTNKTDHYDVNVGSVLPSKAGRQIVKDTGVLSVSDAQMLGNKTQQKNATGQPVPARQSGSPHGVSMTTLRRLISVSHNQYVNPKPASTVDSASRRNGSLTSLKEEIKRNSLSKLHFKQKLNISNTTTQQNNSTKQSVNIESERNVSAPYKEIIPSTGNYYKISGNLTKQSALYDKNGTKEQHTAGI